MKKTVQPSKIRTALKFYDLLWRLCTPALRLNERLKDGFEQRQLNTPLPPADLWIQAASGGEAYLAASLLNRLKPPRPIAVLVTTNTRQGMEIVERSILKVHADNPSIQPNAAYFPFDRPSVMAVAVNQVHPHLLVLLETEIWPGLLYAAKDAQCPVFILNGRITEKSLKMYQKWPSFFAGLGPDRVLAISAEDAARFSALFGEDRVSVMPNIKFDQVALAPSDTPALPDLLPADMDRFVVLGSVRQEEEPDIESMIERIRQAVPETVIGLFPRHMHRIDHWKAVLTKKGDPWTLRSQTAGSVSSGSVILWDTFGELSKAYSAAAAVFVGGSLAPLGGQNFLEPLVFGIVPVIGPSWDNFKWVGESIFAKGLVRQANDWQTAADLLIEQLRSPADRTAIVRAGADYIRSRQGGTAMACRLIEKTLRSTLHNL